MQPFNGGINNTYCTLAKDTLQGFREDYVFFRLDQQRYQLVTGDLSFSDGHITGSDCRIITMFQFQQPNTDQYTHYQTIYHQSFDLTVGDYLVYSNLGDYPRLVEGGDSYAFSTLFVICLVGVTCLVFRLFDNLKGC